ncbi:hypothetical protein, partial [Escherichia coli]|uniref:hypothetical protein n=1 Tax=Escherichia coli TaxID=562 RepID=UPI001BAEE7AE
YKNNILALVNIVFITILYDRTFEMKRVYAAVFWELIFFGCLFFDSVALSVWLGRLFNNLRVAVLYALSFITVVQVTSYSYFNTII